MIIVLRLLHVVGGLLWVGSVALAVLFVAPTAGAIGPAGGQFMGYLVNKTKFPVYVTVLAGLALYWHDMSISGGSFASSPMGMTYGIGGAFAVVALIIGAAVTGRTTNDLGRLSAAVQAQGGPPSPEQAAQLAQLSGRLRSSARITFGLMLVTSVAMAIARYV
jgi:uncharacterized membrane protein